MDNRTIDLRDPDDYIPFDDYEKSIQRYKQRLKARADVLQAYVDRELGPNSCLIVKYQEIEQYLRPTEPCIVILKDGKYITSFTDGDEAENKVKKMINNMKQNTVKLSESQLKKIVAESVKRVLKENLGNPSKLTIENVYELYQYLYDVQDESKDTRELYDNICAWLNKQYPGEMNSAIGS